MTTTTNHVILTRWNPNDDGAVWTTLPDDVQAAIDADELGDTRRAVADALADMVQEATTRLCAEAGIAVEWVNPGEQTFRNGLPTIADDRRHADALFDGDTDDVPPAVVTADRIHRDVLEGGGGCDWDATARAALTNGGDQ